MEKVVTRIPPSPTGHFHIGTARTALFNYLFAKHHGGRIVFRSEDTDRARSKREYEDEIVDGLHWLGITWDEFMRQSERAARHQKLLEQVVASGKAYISKELGKDDPSKTVAVVRLKNPGKEVIFEDLIRGPVNTHTGDLGDFVIARAINDPLYHFAVVADDADAGVTHVIRGEDHISNTARQILIQEALGVPRPQYAHLPLILNQARAKLSKRDGATSMLEYQAEGFLPEAMVNYLALLGWNPGTEQEDFSLAELVPAFSLERVQKSGAAWDREKLLSVNQRWVRKLSDQEFIERGGFAAADPAVLQKVAPLLKERARTFDEARQLLSHEFSFLMSEPTVEPAKLTAKELPTMPGTTKKYLSDVMPLISNLPEASTSEAVKAVIMPFADAEEAKGKGGRGAVLWPLRYALSGQDRSPDPFTLVSILGKKESLSRIQKAIDIL